MTTKLKRLSPILKEMLGDMSFGDFLRSYRIANEFSQVAMAEKLGISKQELCDIEKNRKLVSIERGVLFAKILEHSEKLFLKYIIDDHLRRAGVKLSFTLKESA
jgi:transcriptional regulator with XRE-family HTH domain